LESLWKKKPIRFAKNLKDLGSTDPDVAELLQQLEASLRDEEFQDKDVVKFTGVEATLDGILLSFIAYFLFRLAKDWFDHRRALNTTLIVKLRLALIDSIVRNAEWSVDEVVA
jgi:hypothetical protein